MANLIQKLKGGSKNESKAGCCGVEIIEVKDEQNSQSNDSCCGTNDSADSCCNSCCS